MLKPCTCGRPVDGPLITDAYQGGKWAYVSGNCCGEWMIEFRSNYLPLNSPECKELATKAWNEAPRGQDDELRQTAQAVVDRWDTPSWKDAPHTAEFIDRLRKALAR